MVCCSMGKYSNIQNNYVKAKEKKSFPMQTGRLLVVAFISFMIFLISLPTLGQVIFCLGQEYSDLAYIQSTKVCINSDTLAYVEIECNGFLNWNCKITSEEKIFKRSIVEDFSDYNIEGAD